MRSPKRFIPRYQVIYTELKSKIADGTYSPNTQLPIERELCKAYGSERITIRKALDLLVQDGLIYKRAGVGSFVRDQTLEAEAPAVSAVSNNILFLMRKNSNDIHHNPSALNSMLFFSMEHICKAKGYSLLYVSIDENDDILNVINSNNACGVFLVSTFPEKSYEITAHSGIPAICVNHFHPDLISVLPDNMGGAQRAVRHLISLGHKRIAYINGIPDAQNAIERYDGYRRVLAESGLARDPAIVVDGLWTYDGGKQAMEILLQLPERPTAVFAASDMMAIGAMEAARLHGINLPQDISFIGFDGIDACKFCSPQLSSILSDPMQMARISFLHLMMLINKTNETGDCFVVRLPTILQERASCSLRKESFAKV